MISGWVILLICFSGVIVSAFLAFRDQFNISEAKELAFQTAILAHAQEIKLLKDSKPARDSLRVLISNLQTELEKNKADDMGDYAYVTRFIRKHEQHLATAVANLTPFIEKGDELRKLWIEFDKKYGTNNCSDQELAERIIVNHLSIDNYDSFDDILGYLEKFDSYAK